MTGWRTLACRAQSEEEKSYLSSKIVVAYKFPKTSAIVTSGRASACGARSEEDRAHEGAKASRGVQISSKASAIVTAGGFRFGQALLQISSKTSAIVTGGGLWLSKYCGQVSQNAKPGYLPGDP